MTPAVYVLKQSNNERITIDREWFNSGDKLYTKKGEEIIIVKKLDTYLPCAFFEYLIEDPIFLSVGDKLFTDLQYLPADKETKLKNLLREFYLKGWLMGGDWRNDDWGVDKEDEFLKEYFKLNPNNPT